MTTTVVTLKAERLNRGLTLRKAAAEIGVSRETLRQAELGAGLGPATSKLIADFYGFQVTDIWPVLERDEDAAA